MNRINLITLLIISLFFYSCNRTKKTHYPEGTLKSKQEYKGKQLNGVSTWFYKNGRKQLEVVYKDDLPHGPTTRWYFSGSKELQENYIGGKRNGLVRKWDLQGKLIEEISYKNDTLHGPYTLYHESTEIRVDGHYYMGMQDSTWTYYEISGMKVGDGSYKKGTGFQRSYFSNGRVKLLTHYVNNKKNGYEIAYDREGNEVSRVLYVDDVVSNEGT
jgi:uncharacterized protein